jgi:RHS repeat-associated protein
LNSAFITAYERDTESDLDFAEARYYNPAHGRFTAVDPLMASASPTNPQTWNRYIYVGNNPLNITDPTGLSWYYNSSADRYKWYGDNDTVGEGYTSVVGTTGRDERGVGSFVYQSGGGWVSLNPNGNSFQESATREEATKIFGGMYQCSSCNELFSTAADESVRKGTTVAIAAGVAVAVGTGAGVAMAATGTAAGAGITTLGLAEAGTATTAAATTTAASTATTATIHGARQLAVRGFTQAEVAATRTGTQMLQRDGARVFLKEVAPGKFNVLVQGERGVVTALKNISWKSVTRLAQNYGWNSPIK